MLFRMDTATGEVWSRELMRVGEAKTARMVVGWVPVEEFPWINQSEALRPEGDTGDSGPSITPPPASR